MSNLQIGHLKTADASKISSKPVAEGKVIYSEGPAMQFVDFAGKRHSYGSVLSGIYDNIEKKYIDFSTADEPTILKALYNNGVPSGQLLIIGVKQANYQKIQGFGYLKYIDDNLNSKYFISCNTTITSSDKLYFVIFGAVGSTSSNLYYITVTGSAITSAVDLDGNDVSSIFTISSTKDLFAISSTQVQFKIISASCTNGKQVFIFNNMNS